MKHARKAILGGSVFLCATSLSFGSSNHGGLALSVASAQARVGRPATPVSVAGVARRHVRRGAHLGAGLAGAAARGTAAAVGSAYNGYYGDEAYYRYTGYGYGAASYEAYSRPELSSMLYLNEPVFRASIWLRNGRQRERPQAAFLSLRMTMKSSEGGGGNA